MKKIISLIFVFIFVIVNYSWVSAQTNNTIGSTGTSSCPDITFIDRTGVVSSIPINNLLGSAISNLDTNNSNNPDTTPITTIDRTGKTVPLYLTSNGEITSDKNKAYRVPPTGEYQLLTRKTLLATFGGNSIGKISCPPRITDLQTLFLRLLVILNTVIGLVVFFSIAKAGFIRMTSRGNPEAIKKSSLMIINSVIALILVGGGYILLVFIGTRLLPSDPCYEFSFVDSGKILFFFDQSTISPNLVDDPNLSTCINP